MSNTSIDELNQEKSVHGVLGIRTQGPMRKSMEGTDESTELWPPIVYYII